MARPKRTFTDEQIAKIEQHARDGCYDRTISTALDIPVNTLKRHFGTKIRRWRAQGKLDIRRYLHHQAPRSPQTAIFLAKAVLGMVDKQVIEHKGDTVQLPEGERKIIEATARELKLKLARGA